MLKSKSESLQKEIEEKEAQLKKIGLDYRNSCQSNLNLIKNQEELEERIEKLNLELEFRDQDIKKFSEIIEEKLFDNSHFANFFFLKVKGNIINGKHIRRKQ